MVGKFVTDLALLAMTKPKWCWRDRGCKVGCRFMGVPVGKLNFIIK